MPMLRTLKTSDWMRCCALLAYSYKLPYRSLNIGRLFSYIFYHKTIYSVTSGERGIRTPGGVTLNSFQDCRIRPLCHFSMCECKYKWVLYSFQIVFDVYFFINYLYLENIVKIKWVPSLLIPYFCQNLLKWALLKP